jgi:multiple sugar transport system permease protein
MANLIGNPRHERGARWILAAFYTLLVIGGATMIYPFWLMVTSSISDGLDIRDRAIVPRYLVDRDELFVKYLANRYGNALEVLYTTYPVEGVVRIIDYRGRLRAPKERPSNALVRDWEDFLRQAANPSTIVPGLFQRLTLGFQRFLEARYSAPAPVILNPAAWKALPPIERLNRVYHLDYDSFDYVDLPTWKFGQKAEVASDPIARDFSDFLRSLKPRDVLPVSGESLWRAWLRDRWTPATLSAALGRPVARRDEVPFSLRRPSAPAERGLWDRFVNECWPATLRNGDALSCPESEWRAFLAARYPSDATLAAAWRSAGARRAEAPLPLHELDAAFFVGNEAALRWELVCANYEQVWSFLTGRGHAIGNTALLILLSTLMALTLNPLAAYALSRFPGPVARGSLLVLVLTIAFPIEVAMIPSFLLLREFNMLNSYAAILLPGAVSGFSIFLLKGFFDGLPEELFESATLDGAGEGKVFWHVALPLSRPILAVTALGTFTATYGGFMWALLVCQEPRMWTIMVWLFQFQAINAAKPWLGMASFVVASVPTLLVFLFCQRIILRGIIIPTEK